MKSLYIPAQDAFVRYFDLSATTESDTTCVFLSGLSTPSTLMLSLATHPAIRGERQLLIDYFGAGFSDHPPDFDHQMPSHADIVAAVLEHESIANCILIGHSMGGTVGLYLAMRHPALVSELIMAEANLMAGGGPGTRTIAGIDYDMWMAETHAEYMAKLAHRAREGDSNAQLVAGMWRASDPRGIHLQSQSLVNLPDDFPDQIAELAKRIPVTFIYGDQNLPANNGGVTMPDSPDPAWLTERGVAYEVVPDCGHMMMDDNLDGFAAAVAAALP